jgi:signal transduction histidine kinase
LLLESVRADASLTLWSVCTADALEGRRLATLTTVAQWLRSSGLRRHLRWTEQQLSSPTTVGPATWERWKELAENSARAAGLALETDHAAEQANSLPTLLYNAAHWLEASVDPPPAPTDIGAAAVDCLPSWLVEQLGKLDRASLDGRLAEAASRRQPAAIPGPAASQQLARLLPRLVQQLLRCSDLQRDFDGQLQHEKLLSMKELAYGAGHEINNPLANISSRAQTLLRSETDADRRRKLATINAQAFRAHEMIANMMLFANPPALELAPVRLDKIVDELIDQLQPTAQQQNTTLLRDPAPVLAELEADAVQLRVALAEIVTNSLEALGLGGEIRIELAWDEHDPSLPAIVRIRDTGPGLSPRARRHLFDPFFSGREAGRGLGFGLSRAWRVVTLHGGDIRVESDEPTGTTFCVRLPRRVVDQTPRD